MAQSRRPSTVLLVGIVLMSLNTHCVSLVSVGAGGSELGNDGDNVGDCTGFGGGSCEEVLGDATDGVHVTGVWWKEYVSSSSCPLQKLVDALCWTRGAGPPSWSS